MMTRQLTRRFCVFGVALPISLLVLTGCSADGDATPIGTADATVASSSPARELRDHRIRVAVAGDSNSTGLRGSLPEGMSTGAAWMSLLPPDRFEFAGGWAGDGATSAVIAQNLRTVHGVDLLVVMAGTNDIAHGISAEASFAEIERMADVVDAGTVVVSAIAPFDARRDEAVAFNAHVAEAAREKGWAWVDPWEFLRTVDGGWRAEYVTDGVHTSPEGYAVMASSLAALLEKVWTTGSLAGRG